MERDREILAFSWALYPLPILYTLIQPHTGTARSSPVLLSICELCAREYPFCGSSQPNAAPACLDFHYRLLVSSPADKTKRAIKFYLMAMSDGVQDQVEMIHMIFLLHLCSGAQLEFQKAFTQQVLVFHQLTADESRRPQAM